MEKKTGRLIIVSNRLPFNLVREGKNIKAKESDGGLVSALKSYLEKSDIEKPFDSTLWVGAADFDEARWQKYSEQKKEKATTFEVVPLFIEKSLYAKYYNGFSNSTLWPNFHYFPTFVEFDDETFRAYEEANALFAESVLSILQPGDTVWVHDYQLMLVPGLLRAQHTDARIGFFLHIPFPSFEIFRLLQKPWKEKIIAGLLGADLVGFHTHEYVQHFLKTVQMITGLDHKFRTIFMGERKVKAEMFPLGIDFHKFNKACDLPEVQEVRESITNNLKDKKIIFSVDRLDYTKGITHRLYGFDKFLQRFPEWRGKVVFVLVVVPSRQIVSKYNERKNLIEELIGRINGTYSTLEWQPIIYRYNQLSFPELTALYNVSDVGLITPLRDGMNLVAKEYIASKEDQGVLILSELAGAANELSEALLVNPMDKEEVAEAILTALVMPKDVQAQRIETLQKRLRQYTVTHWMSDFLDQLETVKKEQISEETRYLSGVAVAQIKRAYSSATRRLILLDYDGTLVSFTSNPGEAVPGEDVRTLLQALASDEKNEVSIISGRDASTLEKWLGDIDMNLISEHGAGIRLKKTDWQHLVKSAQTWKDLLHPTLELFCQRSPGSFIENKTHTLVWHYRKVERELGFIRSRELLDSLHHLTRNSELNVIDGNKVIEIRMTGIDKGTIAGKLARREKYDFIIALGDDKTDEDMFKGVGAKAITIKVGGGYSVAQYYLRNPKEVIHFLQDLAAQGQKEPSEQDVLDVHHVDQ